MDIIDTVYTVSFNFASSYYASVAYIS